jgi:Tol biopolymer transport system component
MMTRTLDPAGQPDEPVAGGGRTVDVPRLRFLAAQLADALAFLHAHGIVHRDLKPGNIMLSKSGTKLLDFGLAKSTLSAFGTRGSVVETMQKPLTAEGSIVGTFQYMAPEQLEGEEADARTDIFALGGVLYEMATGKRAFDAKTKTSLIAAIVDRQPTPISQIQPVTPPAFEHVVSKCLEKDPDDRWQSAHDIAEELKWIGAGSQESAVVPAARRSRERLWWIIAPALVVLTAAITWWIGESMREPPRRVESAVLSPETMQFAFEQGGAPALSPDGRRIVFSAVGADSRVMLYVRDLSSGTARALAGTEGASFPFWSPDSRLIGFFVPGKLKKISAEGGPPQSIADAPVGRGGTWSNSGIIVFAPALAGPMMKVAESGGVATLVTNPQAEGETTNRWPSFLPDGKHFLYLSNAAGPNSIRISIGSVDGARRSVLTESESNAVYSPTGHLLYLRERSLVAQRFDPATGKLESEAVVIANQVTRSGRLDACFTVSADGSLLYGTGGGSLSQLVWHDATGKELGRIGKPAYYSGIALSHDDRRVAATIQDPGTGRSDVWITDLATGRDTRVTFDPRDEWASAWSPDDSMLLYGSNEKSAGDVMMKRSSGTGGEELVYGNSAYTMPYSWSPDGKLLAFQELDVQGKTSWDLWLYSIAEKRATPIVRSPFAEVAPRFSPDGRWLLYQSNESGRNEIYVVPVSGTGGKWQISTSGGARARWSRDGRRVYYMTPVAMLAAVEISTHGSELVAGVPGALFKLVPNHESEVPYDVSADGRFLVNLPVEEARTVPLTLVQNWTAGLKE